MTTHFLKKQPAVKKWKNPKKKKKVARIKIARKKRRRERTNQKNE
jgi:hypothetical protein